MTQKHTPGPWEVVKGSNGVKTILAAGKVIARLFGNEKESNARLIAAAPDFYEAALEALVALDPRHEIRDGKIIAGTNVKAVLALQAAIAKAEGK